MFVIPASAHGAFQQGTLAVRLDSNYSVWEGILNKFGDPLEATNIHWHRCSAAEQRLILTNFHERDHLAVFLSTPFGLLIWRCHQVLTRGVTWFSRQFDEVGVREFDGPLVQWYQQKGHKELKKAVASGRAARELVTQFGLSEAVKIAHSTMMDLCEELTSIRTLLSILVGNEPREFVDWTLGDFAELANTAYGWLCKRSGLPHAFEWIPSKSPGKSQVRLYLEDEPPWNGLNIMEAMARYHELQVLERFKGVVARDIERWRENSIFGVYKPAFEFTGGIGADPFVSRGLLGHSLISGIDPATILPGTQVAADEMLPWHRLNALREVSSGHRISGRGGAPIVIRSMPSGIRQEMLKALERAVDGGLIGEGARWLETVGTGPAARISELVRMATSDTLALFVNNFKYMCEKLQTGDAPGAEPFFPEIVFYNDQARIRPRDRIEALAIHMMKTCQALETVYALALLNEEPAVSPEVISESYVAGLKHLHRIAGSRTELVDANCEIAREMLSREMIANSGLGNAGVNSLFLVD